MKEIFKLFTLLICLASASSVYAAQSGIRSNNDSLCRSAEGEIAIHEWGDDSAFHIAGGLAPDLFAPSLSAIVDGNRFGKNSDTIFTFLDRVGNCTAEVFWDNKNNHSIRVISKEFTADVYFRHFAAYAKILSRYLCDAVARSELPLLVHPTSVDDIDAMTTADKECAAIVRHEVAQNTVFLLVAFEDATDATLTAHSVLFAVSRSGLIVDFSLFRYQQYDWQPLIDYLLLEGTE